MKEDFELERKERENMASRFSEKYGEWAIQEQVLKEQLEYEKKKHLELNDKIKLLTIESEQREFQLAAILDNTQGKYDVLRAEWNAMAEQCEIEKRKNKEKVLVLKLWVDDCAILLLFYRGLVLGLKRGFKICIVHIRH